MARKRSRKQNPLAWIVVGLIALGWLASLPKGVLAGLGIVTLGGLVILVASKASFKTGSASFAPGNKATPRKPSKSPAPDKTPALLKFSLDEVEVQASKPHPTAPERISRVATRPDPQTVRRPAHAEGQVLSFSLSEVETAERTELPAPSNNELAREPLSVPAVLEAPTAVVATVPAPLPEPEAAEPEQERKGLFSVVLEAVKPASFQLPTPPSPDYAHWLAAGEFLEVAGEKIRGGMLYTGSRFADRSVSEPSLVNADLPVARGVVDISLRLMSYWPSYASISPEARRGYLEWLSSERKAPHADIGYVFLFFYGLERRILTDARTDRQAAAEVPLLVAEVERLLAIYGENRSFASYAGSLLEFLDCASIGQESYRQPPAPGHSHGYEMPLPLRIGLGQVAADKQPLPTAWALAWVLSDINIGKRTPVIRCRDAFARLFAMRYEQAHGEGLVLPQNKTRLKALYRPASSALSMQELRAWAELPDVSVTAVPRKKLQKIVDSCAEDLEAYSRYLGRNPDTPDALEGLLQLPVTLWPAQVQAELDDLKQRIGDGMLVMSFGELAGRLKSAGALSRDKVLALARALESLSIGMEPDVLAGSRTPKAEESIALFATLVEDGASRSSAGYNAASVTLDLACAVAAADGDTSPQEILMLSRHVDSWTHLSGAHRKRLKAHLRLQLRQAPTLQSLKKRLDPLSTEQKRTVVAFLAHLAQADGEVSPAEVKLLERVYKALQLDAQLLYSDLHIAASAAQARPDTAAVPSVPVSGTATSKEEGFALNLERIAQLQRETEKVSALLAQVFVDEPVAEEPVPVDEQGQQADTGIHGLDADQSAFLRVLVSRAQWSREELEDVAGDMELMLDGVLESINDMAFEHFDMPLVEGEEPFEINPEVKDKLPL